MKKVGIIRCQQTEDICSGTHDFKVVSQGSKAFEELGPAEVVGFVSCGGCPGKRAVTRAKVMVSRGLDVIAFASCISKGNPIEFRCPHYASIKDSVTKAVGSDIQFIEYTH